MRGSPSVTVQHDPLERGTLRTIIREAGLTVAELIDLAD